MRQEQRQTAVYELSRFIREDDQGTYIEVPFDLPADREQLRYILNNETALPCILIIDNLEIEFYDNESVATNQTEFYNLFRHT